MDTVKNPSQITEISLNEAISGHQFSWHIAGSQEPRFVSVHYSRADPGGGGPWGPDPPLFLEWTPPFFNRTPLK